MIKLVLVAYATMIQATDSLIDIICCQRLQDLHAESPEMFGFFNLWGLELGQDIGPDRTDKSLVPRRKSFWKDLWE